MKLRTKLVLAIVSIAMLAGTLLFTGAYVVLSGNFTHLEKEEAFLDVERVNRAIDSQLSSLGATVVDWSAWDATYSFVADRNSRYIQENFDNSVFEYLGVNLIVIIDPDGELAAAKSYDLVTHQEVPLTVEMRTLLAESHISRFVDPGGSYEGILRSPSGPLLFASYPVLTSAGEGPVRGALIMGRYMDDLFLRELTETTLLPISLSILETGENGGLLTPDTADTVLIINRQLITGRTYFDDEMGNPYVLLTLELPRPIYMHGIASLRWLGFGIAGGTTVFAVLGLFALDRLLLARLGRITGAVDSIRKSKNLALRVPQQGKDEIRELSSNLNALLDSLATSQSLLNESLERFEMANRATSDAIWEWNLKTNAHWGSDQFFNLFGYPPEEVNTDIDAWINHIHAEDRQRVWLGINQAIETGTEIWADHYRFYRRDGSLAEIEDRGYILRSAGGEPVRMIGAMQDVTLRKQAEESAGSYALKLSNIARSFSGGILLETAERKIEFVNETFCQIYGIPTSPSAIIGMDCRVSAENDKLKFKNPDEFVSRIGAVVSAGKPVAHELLELADGRFIERDYVPVISEGILKYHLWTFRDVSEQRKAQREYQTLFTEMLEGFALHEIILDGQGRPVDYRFLQINPAFERMTGLKAEDVVGKTVLEILPGTERNWIETYGNVALTGQPAFFNDYSGEFGRFFEVTAFRPAPNQFACMFTDVTERNRAEAEAKQLHEKAEVSSRLAVIGEMAAGIAHEINNPLTGVIGFSELLLAEDLTPEIREQVQIITDGGRRMKEIVKRMLMFARQTKPMRTSVNIHDLIDSTLGIRAYVLKTNNIRVIKNYDPSLPWVTVDPGQMQQVFLNLIINAEYAIRKAGEKGTLTISTKATDSHIQITFKDDGTGMAPEVQAKLFQPFFTTKEVGEGTGLGLSLSRSILLEHGGSIEARSQLGKGTDFTILLPVSSSEEKIMEPPAPEYNSSPEDFKPLHVMTVDDEEGVRKLIKAVLGQNGHTVEAFENPLQALARLDKTRFDLVLLDMRMPGMGGVEFYTHLRREHPDLSGRVIFITGDTLCQDAREFLENNHLPHLNKPFDRAMLMEMVNSLLKPAV